VARITHGWRESLGMSRRSGLRSRGVSALLRLSRRPQVSRVMSSPDHRSKALRAEAVKQFTQRQVQPRTTPRASSSVFSISLLFHLPELASFGSRGRGTAQFGG
jgi:hypothetical protein